MAAVAVAGAAVAAVAGAGAGAVAAVAGAGAAVGAGEATHAPRVHREAGLAGGDARDPAVVARELVVGCCGNGSNKGCGSKFHYRYFDYYKI